MTKKTEISREARERERGQFNHAALVRAQAELGMFQNL